MRDIFRHAVRYLLLLGALWYGATEARADIEARFTGTAPVGGNTQFNYDILLTNNQGIYSGPPTELITIYDIPGYVPGSAAMHLNVGSNLTATTSAQLLGITPVGAMVTDLPLFNVTVSFGNVDDPGGYGCLDPDGCPMGTLTFVSTFSGLNSSGQFAAQALESFLGGELTINQGTVTIPRPFARRRHGPLARIILYVTSQGLYYDAIVAVADLPMEGPFQLLANGATEFGPGDRGYLGGRLWEDVNGNEVQDADDFYFLCVLLPSGRDAR